MKIRRFTPRLGNKPDSAFTLVEAVVAMVIVAAVFVSLYAGMTSGFELIRSSRESLNAAQILEEKFETIRLYTWDQINSNNFIPANFTVPLYLGSTNTSLNYTGVVTISSTPVTEPYSNDLRLVTVQLTWMSGNRLCNRSMSSFVAKNGLQNYIY